jgi:hypothetical protein
MSHGNNNKKNFEVYPPEEFIAAITQHIPEKSFQMVRYYGWYSNKSRGIRNKQGIERSSHEPVAEPDKGIEIRDVSDHQPPRIPSKSWRKCIKKVYEADPLTCPRCGGQMKIISFITDPQVIRHILEHLAAGSESLWLGEASGYRSPPEAPRGPSWKWGDSL